MASRARKNFELLAALTSRASIASRLVPLHCTLSLNSFDGRKPIRDGRDVLLEVGGVWDRRHKQYTKDRPKQTFAMPMHAGQADAARWLAAWFLARRAGDVAEAAKIWSALFVGGRRSGKSYLAGAAVILSAIETPGSLGWALAPTLETTQELDSLLVNLMPRAWYQRRELQSGGASFKLVNGSKIQLRSGHKASGIKAGRVDIGFINEGQLCNVKVFNNLRGAVIDRGGIVLIAANPPDEPIGQWVEDHYNGIEKGERPAVAFQLDPMKNPTIDYSGLESMRSEVDASTFDRDVRGLFTPIGDVVMYAYHVVESRRDPTPDLVDITARVTKRELGRAAGYIVGQDYQLSPAMVAVVIKVFEDPKVPGVELAFVIDEIVVPHSTEEDLCDALEAAGYRGWLEPTDNVAAPVHCAVIADASGWFQDGAHNQGHTSNKVLASRNWRFVYMPQKDSDKNPHILERMKSGNARLAAADGTRRLFIGNHCTATATAMRLYENKHGKPNRQSKHAHLVDAVTYVTYRFWGRPKVASSGVYTSAGKRTRGDEIDPTRQFLKSPTERSGDRADGRRSRADEIKGW